MSVLGAVMMVRVLVMMTVCVRVYVCVYIRVSTYVCVYDEVMVMMDDERGIVSSCPVARMAGILASRSPFFAALTSEPSGILFIGLHADIVERKCYARETCRFGDHTSMRLKNSALASHQHLLAIV